MDIQTETYLEEINDRPLEESLATQTDNMMDRRDLLSRQFEVSDARIFRPASPLFIPKKHGVDKETQVEGDLFDFDVEVRRAVRCNAALSLMPCGRWNPY
jgi:hypothetical protein